MHDDDKCNVLASHHVSLGQIYMLGMRFYCAALVSKLLLSSPNYTLQGNIKIVQRCYTKRGAQVSKDSSQLAT
jgi:hypothetical protein